MKTKLSRDPRLCPRMRVVCEDEIALGPGKVDLLTPVQETGSIRESAERMGCRTAGVEADQRGYIE